MKTTSLTLRALPALLAVAALVFLATPALAQRGAGPHGFGPGSGPGPGFGHGPHGILRALDLTAEQREQVHDIVMRYHDEHFDAREESLHDARRALATAVHSTTATETQIREAAAALGAIEADLAVARHQMWLEIDVLLTEEQRQLAAELVMEGPQERPRRRMGRGRR